MQGVNWVLTQLERGSNGAPTALVAGRWRADGQEGWRQSSTAESVYQPEVAGWQLLSFRQPGTAIRKPGVPPSGNGAKGWWLNPVAEPSSQALGI
jgi:hypothetical protein